MGKEDIINYKWLIDYMIIAGSGEESSNVCCTRRGGSS